MRIAIIGGSGRMGRWCARFLLDDGKEVVITGRNERKLAEAKKQLGVATATNSEAVRGADVVLLSVPIDNFEAVAKEIAPYLKPKQVVVEITSIKESPVEIMHKYLKTGLTLGVHPMFGPGAGSIAKQNFILTPTNKEEKTLAQKVRQYLEVREASVTLMTPGQHDEMMALILGLPHFIAIVAADTLLSRGNIKQMEAVSGTTCKLLLTLVEGVISEDPEFYASLQMSLPNITETEKLFQKSAKIWSDLVEKKDRSQFVRKMNALRDKLKKDNPDFGRAYH
ncbi:MAG: prephenate dehydrogenase, partial [Dehalococcoidia bacterium]